MASDFTQEEINDILSRAAYEMQNFGEHSAETAKQLRDLSIGVKNYTDNLVGSFKQLGTSIGGLAKGMAEGATGAAQYTSTLESGANVASSALSALGPIGKAAGLALQGLGKAAGMVGKQADAVYKGFQDISSSGATTAAGMTGVFENLQKFGYSVEEMGNFATIVKNSSETLASFGTTAGKGLSVFSTVADDIKNSNVGFEFRNMGMSVDSINTGIAGFLKMQTLNGSRAVKTQDQLTAGAAEYVRELNILSKLTGQSNEKLQQNREEMLAQERFAGLKYELQQRIDAGDEAAKEQLRQINLTYEGLGKYGKEAQTGFINSLTGTVSEANAKFLRTLPEAYALSQEPVIDSNKIMAAAAQNATTYMENFGAAAAKIGASGDFGLAVQDLMKGIAYSKMSFEERQKAAEKDIVVTDKSTTSMTKLIDTQKNTTQALQNVAMAGFDLVVPAFQAVADTALLAAEGLQKITGVSPVAKQFAGGATPAVAQAKVASDAASQAAQESRALADASADRVVLAADAEKSAKAELEKLKSINASKAQQAAAEKQIAQAQEARAKAEEEENKAAREAMQKALEAKNARRAVRKQQNQEAMPGAPKPATTPAGPGAAPGGYLSKMVQAESGGRNIANNSGQGGVPTSSAFGTAQMLKGTFEGLAKKAGPNNPLYGKTFENMKADTNLQMEAARQLTDENRQVLLKKGLSTTDAAMYLAHFLGATGASKVLSSPDSTPLKQVVSEEQIAANPNLQKMSTVADIKSWADQKMGNTGYKFGGIVSGPDEGYEATLHGTEAVVPLPDGKTIPVQMAGNNEQLALMSAQLERLDDLVRVMQSQLGVSERILKYAQ